MIQDNLKDDWTIKTSDSTNNTLWFLTLNQQELWFNQRKWDTTIKHRDSARKHCENGAMSKNKYGFCHQKSGFTKHEKQVVFKQLYKVCLIRGWHYQQTQGFYDQIGGKFNQQIGW